MTSTNGVAWVARTAGAVASWRNVVWAKELGIFCAVAATGTQEAMTSPDGINWTPHTASLTGLSGICWAPELGLFVAGGNDDANRLMTSPDGAVWTPRTAATPEDWLSIAWSPSLHLLVAVGDTSNTGFNKRTMSSPDGINWTSHPPPEANDFSSICWAPELGLFCAVSNTGTNRSMVSADGANWTMVPAAAQNFWYTVCWSPELRSFAAGSWNGTQRFMTTSSRTFYIDYASGSNSNAGISTNLPWKTCPGMAGFGGSYTHAAGDRFIFKGGVTWPVACFPMMVTSGGSSETVRDYYGSDTNWFTGVAWSRPLFDFENTQLSPSGWSAGAGVHVLGSNITFDAFEMARHRAPLAVGGDGSYGCVTLLLDGTPSNITVTNCVIRDWSIPTPVIAGSDGGGGGGVHYINAGGGTGLMVTHSKFYQSGSSVRSGASCNFYGIHDHNEYHDTPNGILGGGMVQYNYFHNITDATDPMAHPNATEFFAPSTNHHNLMHGLSANAAAIYHIPDWSGGSNVDLIYDNVVYDCGNQAAVQIDTGGAHTATIGARIYNNTLVHPGLTIRVTERGTGPYGTLDVRNNILITSGLPVAYGNPGAGYANVINYTYASNVVYTATVAAGFGFTSANNYAPTLSFGAYRSTAIDFSSLYTTDILDVTRSVPWDIGAYEFVSLVPPPSVRIAVNDLRAGVIITKSQ